MKLNLDHVKNYMIWKLMKKTVKQIKNILNETFIFGESESKQYFIYKGGEQDDKQKKNTTENQ